MKTAALLAVAASVAKAKAAVLDLPVVIEDSYASTILNVGTPPKSYRLLFDTGSAPTWITSTACTTSSCPNPRPFNRTLYAANASSTSTDLHAFSTITYIDGDGITGAATADRFSVPNSTLAWNQTFLAVNASSWRWITADGLLGLAFSPAAQSQTTPLVESLLWSGALDAPRFALYYGTNLNNTGPQNGRLTIGSSAESTYAAEPLVSTPIMNETTRSVWRAPLRSINLLVSRSANATTIPVTGSLPALSPGAVARANQTWALGGPSSVVFDTGAGRISLPHGTIDAVYYNLGWNMTKLQTGEERFTCAAMNASWALTFTLGEGDEKDDVSYSIRGDEFVADGEQCMPPFDDSGRGGFALAGRVWLRRWYSVFDYGAESVDEYSPSISFARLKPEWDYLARE